MPPRCKQNLYSTKYFPLNLDFCYAAEHPTNTRERLVMHWYLFQVEAYNKTSRWTIDKCVNKSFISVAQERLLSVEESSKTKPTEVGFDTFKLIERKILPHSVKNISHPLSGFVRKNEATKRVKVFQGSRFLGLWGDLENKRGKYMWAYSRRKLWHLWEANLKTRSQTQGF